MRRVTLAFLLVALSAAVWSPRSQAAPPEPAFARGEILVQYRDGVTDAQRGAARGWVGGVAKRQLRAPQAGDGGLEVVALRGVAVHAAIATLQADPHVLFAEPNWLYTIPPVQKTAFATDRGYTNGSHWGLYGNATTPANQYGSQAGEAWANDFTGGAGVYVGVIDEGIRFDHCDLAPNIWTNPYDPADGIDNDRNGYVDDVHGWDFYHGDSTIYDAGEDNHGTHVGGTIGSEANNGACSVSPEGSGGSVGVNWDVQLISGKFLGPDGGYLEDAVRAVDYFTNLKTRHNLNIVALNNSWGGGGYSRALHEAIIRAARVDILFIAAAGNAASNNDARPSYPSNYSTTVGTSTVSPASYDSVIAVAAIDMNGALASFSNYGRSTVDLGAPGVGIWSTTADATDSYAQYSGTSMATPHVTGAVALYAGAHLAARGERLSGQQLRDALLKNGAKTGSLNRKTATGTRLDVSCLPFPGHSSGLPTCVR